MNDSDELRYFARRVLQSHSDSSADHHWRDFHSGCWRVVDHFDTGNRRYVVAKKSACPGRLMPEEQELLRRRARGDGLKEIAIDLGVSISVVSRRLSLAMDKLGIRSHAELPRLFPLVDRMG